MFYDDREVHPQRFQIIPLSEIETFIIKNHGALQCNASCATKIYNFFIYYHASWKRKKSVSKCEGCTGNPKSSSLGKETTQKKSPDWRWVKPWSLKKKKKSFTRSVLFIIICLCVHWCLEHLGFCQHVLMQPSFKALKIISLKIESYFPGDISRLVSIVMLNKFLEAL